MFEWSQECWEARHDVRMTQEEMAAAVGVSLSTWRRWEGAETNPAVWRKEAARDAFVMERATYVAARLAAGPSPAGGDRRDRGERD